MPSSNETVLIKHKKKKYEIRKEEIKWILNKLYENDFHSDIHKLHETLKKKKLLNDIFLSAICTSTTTKNGNVYKKETSDTFHQAQLQ